MTGYSIPELSDIIGDLKRRDMTPRQHIPGTNIIDPSSPVAANLNFGSGIGMTRTQYTEPVTNQPRVKMTWTWPDLIILATSTAHDPAVGYIVTVAIGTNEPFYVNTNYVTESLTLDSFPLNTNVTITVTAWSRLGRKGTPITRTDSTSKDSTPPTQTSTPTVTGVLKGLRVVWDGLNVSAGAMEADLDYVEIHYSTTGPTFTPSSTTLQSERFFAGGGTTTIATPNYTLGYIRLVPVDTSGNKGVTSTAASATPQQAVATDMGIALPGDIAFRDEGNLIIDGSFEVSAIRTDRTTNSQKAGGSQITFDSTSGFASHGTWSLKFIGDATNDKFFYLTNIPQAGQIPVSPNAKLYASVKIRGISANGTARMGFRWTDAAGVQTFAVAVSTTSSTGSYVLFESVITVPSTAVYLNVYLQTVGQTTGDWYFDQVQVRNIIGTVLIEDAAITNAKIANLAVNDAKIENLSGGKIIAQSVTADKVALGVLKNNLVNDPSFEEPYTMTAFGLVGDNVDRWRMDNHTDTGDISTKVFNGSSRSGSGSLQLKADGVGTVSAVSNAFPILNGQLYRVQFSAVSTGTSPFLTFSVLSGDTQVGINDTTDAITATDDNDPPFTVTTKALTSNVATLTTSVAHDFLSGDSVFVDGVDATFNGRYTLTGVTATTISYSKTASNVTATAATGTVRRNLKPPVVTIPVDPALFQTYSFSFTGTAKPWAGIRFTNINGGGQSIYIDDVSVIPVGGGGAAELTAAGLRLFDSSGLEVGSFVSNRPNYFTVNGPEGTLASIDQSGRGSFTNLESANDPQVLGRPLVGVLNDFEIPSDTGASAVQPGILDQLPRGVVGFGLRTIANGSVLTANKGIYEVSFVAEAGRAYRLTVTAPRMQIDSDGTQGFQVRLVRPATIGGEADTPTTTNGLSLGWMNVMGGTVGRQPNVPPFVDLLRCNWNGGVVGSGVGELTPGINKVLLMTGNSMTIGTADTDFEIIVEDVGLDLPTTGRINNSTAAAPDPSTPSPKTYTKTFNRTDFANWRESGVERTDITSTIYQGQSSSSSINGDQRCAFYFGTAFFDTVTASGVNIVKLEVYAYANHWWYDSGGTARLKLHGSANKPASMPSMTTVGDYHFDKPEGRWITIPSSFYNGFEAGTYRGFGFGPANTSSRTYYGGFECRSHSVVGSKVAKIKVTYTK